MIDKQAFINAKSALKPIEIPEWGITVYIRKWSAAERTAFLASRETSEYRYKDVYDDMIRIAQMTLCDETGARLFTNSKEDFELLNEKDADIMTRIYELVADYNGLGEKSEKEAIKN